MAWLEERGDQFHLCLRVDGQKLKRSLKTADREEAEALLLRVHRRQRLIKQGDLDVPENADLLTFLLSEGRREKPTGVLKRSLTLQELINQFRAASLPERWRRIPGTRSTSTWSTFSAS